MSNLRISVYTVCQIFVLPLNELQVQVWTNQIEPVLFLLHAEKQRVM